MQRRLVIVTVLFGLGFIGPRAYGERPTAAQIADLKMAVNTPLGWAPVLKAFYALNVDAAEKALTKASALAKNKTPHVRHRIAVL